MKKNFFKETFAFCAMLIMLLSFTNCNDNNASYSSNENAMALLSNSSKKITIQAVTYFTGEDTWAKVWEQVIKDYMDKNPNIIIDNDATPSPNDVIRTRITADLQSEIVPDITFYFNGIDAKQLVESGKVIAWDDEIKNDPEWSLNFLTVPIENSKFNGKLYALPYIGYYEGVFINKNLFDKNEIKIPTTWDELMKTCDTFNEKGIIPMAQSLKDPRYLWEVTTLSAGGPSSHLKENAYNPSWITALNAIKILYDRKAFPEDAENLTDDEAKSLFISEKAAMFINGSWAAGSLEKDKYEIIYLPVVPDGKGYSKDIVAGCGSGWYMNAEKNDENGGESLKFIKYMTSPEIMAKFAKAGGVPMIKIGNESKSLESKIGYEFLEKARSQSDSTDSYLSKEAFNAINDNIYKFLKDEIDAQKLLDDSKALNQ